MSENRDSGHDALSEYLRASVASLGVSWHELSRRSVDPETERFLRVQYLIDLSRGRVTIPPEPWRLRALAVGLGADLERLKRLTARQWVRVMDVPLGGDEHVIVNVPADLSEADRQRVVKWAQELAKDLSERKDD